jgi:hypothetical protein
MTRSLLFGALLGLGLFIIRSFKDKHVVIFRVVYIFISILLVYRYIYI